jgi:prepilin-type N-terminal cleavage/methylation domain-containing protein
MAQLARRLHVSRRMRTLRGPRTAGFTIIELVMVMVLISILASIAYLRVGPTLERTRVRGATNIMAGDLQYAQVLAARYRTPMTISVNAAAKTYPIMDRAANVYRVRDFGPGGDYALTELTAVPATVEVFPNAVVGQSATYTLGLNGRERRITFSRAGQIRVSTVP